MEANDKPLNTPQNNEETESKNIPRDECTEAVSASPFAEMTSDDFPAPPSRSRTPIYDQVFEKALKEGVADVKIACLPEVKPDPSFVKTGNNLYSGLRTRSNRYEEDNDVTIDLKTPLLSHDKTVFRVVLKKKAKTS